MVHHRPYRLSVTVLIAVACFVLFSLLYSVGFLSALEHRLSDSLYGGRQPLDNIVLVAIDDKSIQSLGRWPWDRSVLAEGIRKLHLASAIGIDIGFYEPSTPESDQSLADALKYAGHAVLSSEFTSFGNFNGTLIGQSPLLPLPILRDAADFGYVNIQTDPDGVTRSVNLAILGDIDSFTAKVYEQLRPKAQIPKLPRFLINFVSSPGTFTTYSFFDVYSGVVPSETFADKLVFVGATAPNLHDTYFVPTSQGTLMPGVEIHANILQTLLTHHYLFPEDYLFVLLGIFTTSVVVLVCLLLFRVRTSAFVLLLGNAGYLILAIVLFDRGLLLNILYVPLTTVGTFSTLMSYFYAAEHRHRSFISQAFGRYVSPAVIDKIVQDPDRLRLGGETRTITIFFSDVRGFTSISEKLTPEKLVHLLNDYMTEMTNIILDSEGTVDKYIGDAIMAFWNAPLDLPDHPRRAASACLTMIHRLKEKQKLWAQDGFPHLDIGIGLNTGPAVIGNMGSHQRFSYTAMGDTINLGSRLEGVNKEYGTHILVSKTTFDLIKDKFLCRPVDKIRVKGRGEPLMIYELLNTHTDSTLLEKEYALGFEEGLALYLDQKWQHAIKHFTGLKKKFSSPIHSADTSCNVFILRCQEFRKNPPPRPWNGVFTMTHK